MLLEEIIPTFYFLPFTKVVKRPCHNLDTDVTEVGIQNTFVTTSLLAPISNPSQLLICSPAL